MAKAKDEKAPAQASESVAGDSALQPITDDTTTHAAVRTTPKTRSRVKPEAYNKEQLESVSAALRELPVKVEEKKGLSRMEAVRELRPEIENLRRKGYSIADIAAMLATLGVTISASTLMNYLQAARASAPKQRGAKRAKSES